MTTAYVRASGTEDILILDVLEKVMQIMTSDGSLSRLIGTKNLLNVESTIALPTIGGFGLNLDYVLASSFREQTNWTLWTDAEASAAVQVQGGGHFFGTKHRHRAHLSFDFHGSANYSFTEDEKRFQVYIQPWPEDHVLFKYELYSQLNLDDHEERLTAQSEQKVEIYETPASLDKTLGVKLTTEIEAENVKQEQERTRRMKITVNHFYGYDVSFHLKRGQSLLGNLKKLWVYCSRPGLSNGEWEHRLEMLIESDKVNDTAEFVQIRFLPPWRNRVETRVEVSENGQVDGSANISSTQWTLGGAYENDGDEQKFSAKLKHSGGTASIAFRGKIKENFKLRIENTDESWPFEIAFTQTSIQSRHVHYPIFNRVHHNVKVTLKNEYSATLQTEWNSGERDGLLREGIVKLDLTTPEGISSFHTGLCWTEGEQYSMLDHTVPGYGRQITIMAHLERPGIEQFELSAGANQFMSNDFWILLSDKPAIVSLHTWTNSPQRPELNLNSSMAWTLGYQTYKGGMSNAHATLIVPAKGIDALLQTEIKWKGNKVSPSPWVKEAELIFTARVFPENESQYFQGRVKHTTENDVHTSVTIEFSPTVVYQADSYLYRGRNLHQLCVQWPESQLNVNTSYSLQVIPRVVIATKHELTYNQMPWGYMHLEFMYDPFTGKLGFVHNLTREINSKSKLLTLCEFGTELNGQLSVETFQCDYAAAARFALVISPWEVDFGGESKMALKVDDNGGSFVFRLLKTQPLNGGKYGVEILSEVHNLETLNAKALMAVYLSGTEEKTAGCDLDLRWSNDSRLCAVTCSKQNLGSISLIEKNRLQTGTNFDGSFMFAITPEHAFNDFNGVYCNYNYMLLVDSEKIMGEFYGDYTPNAGVGPGTPLRLYIQFTHNPDYTDGRLETELNSQTLGYWCKYEMLTSMSRYSLKGIDSSDTNRTLKVENIFGYRPLEGRGMRAIQNSIDVTISPTGDLLKCYTDFVQPGVKEKSSLDFGYKMVKNSAGLWIEAILSDAKELSAKAQFDYDNSWNVVSGDVHFSVPRLSTNMRLYESIKRQQDEVIFASSTLVLANCSTKRVYRFEKNVTLKKMGADQEDKISFTLDWNSNLIWIKNGSLNYVATKKDQTEHKHVTAEWSDRFTSELEMSVSTDPSKSQVMYTVNGRLGEKSVKSSASFAAFSDADSRLRMGGYAYLILPEFEIGPVNYTRIVSENPEKYDEYQRVEIKPGSLIQSNYVLEQHTIHQERGTKSESVTLEKSILVDEAPLLQLNFVHGKTEPLDLRFSLAPAQIAGYAFENLTLAVKSDQPFSQTNVSKLDIFGLVQVKPWLDPVTGAIYMVNDRTQKRKDFVLELKRLGTQVGGELTSDYVTEGGGMEITGVLNLNKAPELSESFQNSDWNIGFVYTRLLTETQRRLMLALNFTSPLEGQVREGHIAFLDDQNQRNRIISFEASTDKEMKINTTTRISHDQADYGASFSCAVKNLAPVIPDYSIHLEAVKNSTLQRLKLDQNEVNSAELLNYLDNHTVEINIARDKEPRLFVQTNFLRWFEEMSTEGELVTDEGGRLLIVQIPNAFCKISVRDQEKFASVQIRLSDSKDVDGTITWEITNSTTEHQENTHQITINVNSSVDVIPTTSANIKTTQEFDLSGQKRIGFGVQGELEVAEILERKRVSLNVGLPDDSNRPLRLDLNTNCFAPVQGYLEVQTRDSIYSYKHSIKSPETREDGNSEWISVADCAMFTRSHFYCTVETRTSIRLANASFSINHQAGEYQVELAWNKTNRGLASCLMAVGESSILFEVKTPVSDIRSSFAAVSHPPTDSDQYQAYSVSWSSKDAFLQDSSRNVNLDMTLYKRKKLDSIASSTTFGAELQSNLLKQNYAALILNHSCDNEKVEIEMKMLFDENLDSDHSLLMSLTKGVNGTLHSALDLKLDTYHAKITGAHDFRSDLVRSIIKFMTDSNVHVWNFTLVPWTFLMIKNEKGTKLLSTLERNRTGLRWSQTFEHESGKIKLNQTAAITLFPFNVLVQLSSLKGLATMATSFNEANELLTTISHRTVGEDTDQRDSTLRLHVDPDNVIHASLHWRPSMIKDAVLYGSELADKGLVQSVVDSHLTPLVDWHDNLQSKIREEFIKVLNAEQVKAFYDISTDDLQAMFDTLKIWHTDDQFYIRTLKVPAVEHFMESDVRLFEKNVTDVVSRYKQIFFDETRKSLTNTSWITEAIERIKMDVESDTYLLFERTLKGMLNTFIGTISAINGTNRIVFQRAAVCAQALFTMKKRIFEWAGDVHEQMSGIFSSSFRKSVEDFAAHLSKDIPALSPMWEYMYSYLVSTKELVSFAIAQAKKMTFNSFRCKDMNEVVQLIEDDQIDNASDVFFKPELSKFEISSEQGRVQISSYFPKLYGYFGTLSATSTFWKQVLPLLHPKQAIKSLTYAYDQYQRNFDAVRKLAKLIPPYDKVAWLMIGKSGYAYAITFNGLFFLIPKEEKSSYLLLRGIHSSALRIVQNFEADKWNTSVLMDGVKVNVDSDGKVSSESAGSRTYVCLPHLLEHEDLQGSISRAGDRIQLKIKQSGTNNYLLSIIFDVNLNIIQLTTSGQLHGQVRGLLGSGSFDQLDDLHSPNASFKVHSLNAFESWVYKDRARREELSEIPASEWLHNWCTEQFNGFGSCTKEVNPKPWIEACITVANNVSGWWIENPDHAENPEQLFEDHACTVVRAYVQACNIRDVPLRVPAACVRCIKNLKGDGLNHTDFIEESASRGHVYFVLQLRACMLQREKEIRELITLLGHSRASTMTYSAILYGGNAGIGEVNWLTSSSGQTRMTGSDFIETLEGMLSNKNMVDWIRAKVLEKNKIPQVIAGLMAAVRLPAPQLPVHEHILLYTCDKCEGPDTSEYVAIRRMLLRKGLDFHYMPNTSFATSEGMSDTVFRMDSVNRFTEINSEGFVTEFETGSVSPPRDKCAAIAQNAHGFIWAYQNVTTTPRRLRIVSVVLARQLAQPVSVAKRCICRDNLYGQGILDCVDKKKESKLSKVEHVVEE
ncbi:unnamed protein product [Calicophoron daubneyi]|uniref:VWFD domain-containing protein n=1 Tax=Calicophoron daubneyi TaxID=300641 RepID=A0AAV2TK75_CALDB